MPYAVCNTVTDFVDRCDISATYTLQIYTADDPESPGMWSTVGDPKLPLLDILQLLIAWEALHTQHIFRIECIERYEEYIDISYDVYYPSI